MKTQKNILITLAMVLTMALPITGYSQEDASPTLEEQAETIAEFFVSENYDDVRDKLLNDTHGNSTISDVMRSYIRGEIAYFKSRLPGEMWTLFQKHSAYKAIHRMGSKARDLFYAEIKDKTEARLEVEKKKVWDEMKAEKEAARQVEREKIINANKALHELYEEAKSPSGFWEDLFGF